MRTLAETIADHVRREPEGVAFYGDDASMTWSEYAARSDRLGAVLTELDLAPGDRVAVVLPDGPGVHAAFVACEKSSLITMGIGPRAARAELIHLLRKSGARALISRARYRDLDMARFVASARDEGLDLRHHIVTSGELEVDTPLLVDGASHTPRAESLSRLSERWAGPEDIFLLNSTSGTTGNLRFANVHG